MPFDQISVKVAIISNEFLSAAVLQYKIALKTDVGKVSLSMAIRQGLVGPKFQLNSCNGSVLETKGNQVKIPELETIDSISCKADTRNR